MDGIILTYNTNVPAEITAINNQLFGRVVKIRRNNRLFLYYYQGILHEIPYFKLSNGSYFITNESNIDIRQLDINTFKANVDIGKNNLITAQEYFRNKYRNKRVRNLD